MIAKLSWLKLVALTLLLWSAGTRRTLKPWFQTQRSRREPSAPRTLSTCAAMVPPSYAI